jgi:hypothetical protein
MFGFWTHDILLYAVRRRTAKGRRMAEIDFPVVLHLYFFSYVA